MSKKKKGYKKPNAFIYFVAIRIARLYAKIKLGLKIEKNEIKKQKGPYVIIANHESVIDFVNLVSCTNKRMAVVISNSFYQSMKINPLLKIMGVIPKQQFQTTVSDLKKMKSAVEANMPLVLYPAGLMTENGICTPIPQATGKLLKWLDVDVYLGFTKGSYLTKPKWGKGFRKGKITMNVTKLLSKQQLNDLSSDELEKLIEEKLYFNAYQNQEEDMIKHKNGNHIEGLENVLHMCPKCNKEFSMKNVSIDTMKCENCGNEVYMDEYSFLQPKTNNDVCFKYVNEWYDYIYNKLFETIKNNQTFTLEDNMVIKMINYKKHKFEEVGKGVLKLTKEGFLIKGIINNVEEEIFIPIKNIPIFPFNPGVHLELQKENVIYRCCLEKNQEIMKWIMALKIFYILNN